MIEDNEKESILCKSVANKLPKYDYKDEYSKEKYNKVWKSLSDNEVRAYYNNGFRHSRSAFKRIRIELNKAMIEWEKGE